MSGIYDSREKVGKSVTKVCFSYADFSAPSTSCPTASGAFREPLPASSATFLILRSVPGLLAALEGTPTPDLYASAAAAWEPSLCASAGAVGVAVVGCGLVL